MDIQGFVMRDFLKKRNRTIMKIHYLLSESQFNRNNLRKIIIIFFSLLLVGFIGYKLPGGDDLHGVFLPATNLLISGYSPYSETMFFSPVWTLIPFIPIVILPPALGRAIIFVLSLCAYAFSAWRFGAKPVAIIAFLLSPPIVMSLWLSSVDWIPILGFVLPPQIGLFFILVKPQMGSIVAIFWFFDALHRGGLKEIIRVFSPIILAVVLTFFFYGMWPLQSSNLVSIEHNASIWPISIPIGFGLIVSAFRKHEIKYAIAASPCLSPYVMVTSWVSVLIPLLLSIPELISVLIGSWIFIYIRTISF
jgi:hypothetical protein